MERKIIKTPNYVNKAGVIRLDFWSPDFDALVDNKGYDVIWERAIPCPCAKRQGAVMSACQNCQGTGWVFINPKQIKAVAQSINKDTMYKEWSQERLGTASFTVRSEYRLNFMDRITLLGSVSVDCENRIVYSLDGKCLINTIYPIGEVMDIFVFVSPREPLKLLSAGDYEVCNEHFVQFNPDVVQTGDSVTISYKHQVQYHILDLNHDVRNTIVLNNSSREEQLVLPVSAVGRRVNLVLNQSDFTGMNVFDNSYE